MARVQTWEASDQFWNLAEQLIPKSPRVAEKIYKRKPGGGKKPKYGDHYRDC